MTRMTLIIVFVFFAVISGCAQETRNGYRIFFEGSPVVYDNRVYHLGQSIGSVQSTSTRNNITKVIVSIDEEFRSLITRNVVFYVTGGRITLDKWAVYGEKTAPDAAFCGFGSKGAYKWYRFKHIIGNAGIAASNRVRMLNERFVAGS